ncbi:AAA family ATPase [Paraoerskovia sediminicola]|nr:AAA family ATPase [Paraoerskovia sediminicola]
MHKPELLILDEPNAGLDPLIQQEFMELMREVRAEGRTVFLSSHTLSEVERVADRVGIIRHGRLIVVERIDALKQKAIRRLDFEFAEAVPADLFAGVEGVRDVEAHETHVGVSYDGSVNAVLRAAMQHEVLNLHSRDADLEEIFLAYYRDGADEKDESSGPAGRTTSDESQDEAPASRSAARAARTGGAGGIGGTGGAGGTRRSTGRDTRRSAGRSTNRTRRGGADVD